LASPIAVLQPTFTGDLSHVCLACHTVEPDPQTSHVTFRTDSR